VSYAIAGASFGYATLWTSLFALPLIAALQMMSSRLGMVSGRGLAGAARTQWSNAVVVPLCLVLAGANILTLGADLGGMADVTHMVTGVPATVCTVAYTVVLGVLLAVLSYRQIERLFRWLCLVLFAWVAAGVLARPDWGAAAAATVVPHIEWSREYLSTLVALLGATVSPYFLFWQTSQEVESEISKGRESVTQRRGASAGEIERSTVDVLAGSFVSKLITYFITITAAATLFAQGNKHVATAQDAAAALRPIAGEAATWLFALGVIGTGLLAIPVLAGSCAHAFSEAFRWRASLAEKPNRAPNFYLVLFVAMLIGLGLVWTGWSVVDMLFWASVVNGVLAPVCILVVILLSRDRALMGMHACRGWMERLGWIGFAVAGSAATAMLIGLALT
jgi:NRAMP (natural resistance-associated macrophage protein)-like metal ion transporter